MPAPVEVVQHYEDEQHHVSVATPPGKQESVPLQFPRPKSIQRPNLSFLKRAFSSDASLRSAAQDEPTPDLDRSEATSPSNSIGARTPRGSRSNLSYFNFLPSRSRDSVPPKTASKGRGATFDLVNQEDDSSPSDLSGSNSTHEDEASSDDNAHDHIQARSSSSGTSLSRHDEVSAVPQIEDALAHASENEVGPHSEVFQEISPARDIALQTDLEDVDLGTRPMPDSEDQIEVAAPVVAVDEQQGSDAPVTTDSTDGSQESKTSVWNRFKSECTAVYCPIEQPPLIMPTAPTDAEKTLYLKTNRLGLYGFGVFSFLSLSAGMWLFVVSSPIFYWFGAVVALLQIYLIISYTVSVCGKDYDIDQHKRWVEEHPINLDTAPTVDIYLPCCKEPIEILENTYKHVQKLDWPEGKLQVYVLDDGASEAVEALAAQYGYNYICREDRPRLKKAGNLRWAFTRTSGDYFTIYDADFCPRPDFLHETMPVHLANPDTAIVQTPQFFRTSVEQTWVEQGAGAVQELFYRVVQVNRNRWNASICVGSNAVYRRESLVEAGGTAEIGFSEDVHTGFYATDRGWKVRYLPLCLACGICPDTPRAFFSQQMRWCMGSTTLLTNMDFWRSKLSIVQKVCYLSGMMYYTAISMSIFISPMPGLLMLWCRPNYVRYYNLAFAIPSIFYAVIAIRAWSRARYGFNAQFIMVIQSYAYLTAIKDRLFGRALAWVPSGDTKAHKNNKYRNMRILAACWMTTVLGVLISGVCYQVLLHGLPWYDTLPLILLDTFNFFLAHRFIFWSGKI